jgi:diguanylate cyclase (GGDEF)-like protein
VNTAMFVEALQEFKQRFVALTESLSALQELSGINVREQEAEQVLQAALKILMEYEHLERCSVFKIEGNVLVNIAGLGWEELSQPLSIASSADRTKASFSLGQGLIGLAAKTGHIQHCRNCLTDTRFAFLPCTDKTLQGSLIAIPIFVDSEIFGVLNVYHPHPFFFTEEHERLLAIFTKVMGQLLSSNRHLRRLEQTVQERTHELGQALTEAQALRERYEQLSLIDDLTELHNRRFFFPETEAAVARALRYRRPLSLMILDLDHFKHVNDTFGHVVGDKVLREVAAILKAESRAGDILARFGGEEFALVLTDTDLEGAVPLADRLRQRVKSAAQDALAPGLSISLSGGVAAIDESLHSLETAPSVLAALVKQADLALYFAKTRGRDRVATTRDLPPDLKGP